jgi:acetyltransferase
MAVNLITIAMPALVRIAGAHGTASRREVLPLDREPYARAVRLKDGSRGLIRPIRPEDEPLMVKFHQGLSVTTVYHRYFAMLKLEARIAHQRLARICLADFEREIALVLDREIPGTAEHEILGVARLSRIEGTDEAEYAILLTDRWQRQGLGSMMTRHAMEVARAEGITRLRIVVLLENREMWRLAHRHGFKVKESKDGEMVAEVTL